MNEDIELQLTRILAPEKLEARNRLKDQQLVHYTSAENAMRILKFGEVWLRNLRVMNDVSEVDHGLSFMRASIQADPTDRSQFGGLKAALHSLDSVFPGIANQLLQNFDGAFWWVRNETYVACLSDVQEDENGLGRLSMWRNYAAGQTGVGIIVKTDLFGYDSPDRGVYSTPVLYDTEQQLDARLQVTAGAILQNAEFLRKDVGLDLVRWSFGQLMRDYAIGFKHPGFKEEREWRVFHTLNVDNLQKLKIETEAIAGVPQRILKFNLKDNDMSYPDLIAGLIIGPSPHQRVIAQSLADVLRVQGMTEDQFTIQFSPIPLRSG